ncbi:MAG: bifunctional riboflavin kinase/FAD synthetase [Alphaproteobacteria bacterium]|nr:bifunctional riboflavin kinase/FAD synthetase [Alphaproteobacteria bacterium]
MEIVRSLQAVEPRHQGAVVAIGNFDGVHLGHRAVIGEAARIAGDLHAKLAVLTFEPHPRLFFQPTIEPFRLTTATVRATKLEELGVDLMFELRFDRAFAEISADAFIEDVLHRTIGARHVVIGYDFNFGHRRRGTPDMLVERAGHLGFGATKVSAVHESDGAVYSSSRIRQCLSEGDPRGAASLLGAPWEVEGIVEEGDRRGRTIGFPTANLRLGPLVCPRLGVYAVRARLDEGEGAGSWMTGVANLGQRPTVNDRGILLEVHIFDRDLDLYGRRLRVRLIDFIRPERKFDGLDALTAQIAADAARARELLGS